MTKIDALTRIQKSLNKLVLTSPPQLQKVRWQACHYMNSYFLIILQEVRTEFDGFEQLFSRYLHESDQVSIDWQEIQPPPEETVSYN